MDVATQQGSADRQAVGGAFVLERMLFARDQTWDVIERVAPLIRPGMRESEAVALCRDTIAACGADRIWHPVIIRFGENTLKTFKQRSDDDPRLQADDIFFIDLGVVWDGHEGDAGATFVVGDDAQKHACAAAARQVFDAVRERWQAGGVAGTALYAFAEQRAAELGWRLNLDIKGHRVSDFPHAIYKAGNLGDFEARPDAGLWILEIQLAHPGRPFGAFYEDLLI
jgi:Xaa-Pro aminopeptidase